MTSVVDMVAAQVGRAPHATALVDRGRRWSYREVDARANQLANLLVDMGVTLETRVGVCCERSADMIVALLAILKAGAAYVPIDPEYPAARRDFIVQDARLPVVVTQCDLAGLFAVPTLCVDGGATASSEPPRACVRGDHAMYVLYTSGSTGQPKGVVGLHGATVNRLHWQQDIYPFAPTEVASARTTLGFVDSVAEIFAPLAFGAPLVMIGDAAQRDAVRMIDELAAHRATRIVLVPSLLATMLEVLPDLAQRAPDLQYWFVGGEPVPVALVERFRRALPGRKLINIYGATELTADATYYDFDAMPGGLATSPIGLPLPGVHARILDPELREVPDGAVGEICISGACLSRGYHARPQLTVDRFVPNPFPEGGRLYRTRDLGRRLATGDIQYLGRLDQLVKIRGFRVELGEVEAVVGAAPGVHHAVAIARDDQLVAFYTAERELPCGELRAFVADRVPAAAVPTLFVRVERFPTNANGKVDRRQLERVPVAPLDAGPPPATDDERRVAEVWQAILGLPAIGREQSFFAIGGTSLTAMRVAAKLREQLGVQLAVSDVFERPTVATLAARVATAAPARVGPALASSGHPLPASFPLSYYQFPFWMFRALTGGVSIVADAFAFAEAVDVERLQAAFSRTVAAFDALWMRYPRFRPVQEIVPRGTVRFEVVEHGDVAREADRNNERPFDLMAPPHVHARLVRGPDGDRLLVAIPHVAGDMAAMELFRRDLEAHYYGMPLAPRGGASLFDLVEWERELPDAGGDAAYWESIARGPALNRLPARLFATARERAFATRRLSPAQLERTGDHARARSISVPLAIVGAIYAALARVAEVDDPILLLQVEKRDRSELRDLFTNLTALMTCRVRAGRGPVAEVVEQVARQLVASSDHTDRAMRHPTQWNDFWLRAPRPLRRGLEAVSTRLTRRWSVDRHVIAQYVFALVPLQRKRRDVMFSVNVMPEVAQPTAGFRIVRRRELPAMLKPDDLVTGADALLDRTLQIHVTNAGGLAVNLYGGGVSQRGLDEIADAIVAALEELA